MNRIRDTSVTNNQKENIVASEPSNNVNNSTNNNNNNKILTKEEKEIEEMKLALGLTDAEVREFMNEKKKRNQIRAN